MCSSLLCQEMFGVIFSRYVGKIVGLCQLRVFLKVNFLFRAGKSTNDLVRPSQWCADLDNGRAD